MANHLSQQGGTFHAVFEAKPDWLHSGRGLEIHDRRRWSKQDHSRLRRIRRRADAGRQGPHHRDVGRKSHGCPHRVSAAALQGGGRAEDQRQGNEQMNTPPRAI